MTDLGTLCGNFSALRPSMIGVKSSYIFPQTGFGWAALIMPSL